MRPNSTGDWTDVKCEWFDTVKSLQNNYYWVRQFDGSPIVFLYGIVCTFGALANFFVLFAFIRTEKLRNLRNSFIVNLAASDLLLCVVTAPVTLYTSVNLFWPFGNISCKVLASVQAVNTFVSSLTLALIALDRVLLTICPVRWRLAATAPIVCYCIVWIVSILVALPYSLAVKAQQVTHFEPWNDGSTPEMLEACEETFPEICIEMQDTWDRAYISKMTFTLVVLAIQYVLPLVALAFAYVQIGSTIRRRSKFSRTIDSTRRMNNQNRNRRALLLLFLLVLTYAICWAPMNVYNVLNGFEIIDYSQYRYLFCHLVGISSACVNPITYALVNESFRNALHHMLISFRPFNAATSAIAAHPFTNSVQTKTTKKNTRTPFSCHAEQSITDDVQTLANSNL
ncbi:unnamed protein product [Auanema sp. JU1783]|nr:unnamed protein product [Auanema sp. JU1783]